MANVLGSLFVELGLNTAGFKEGMDKASYVASQATKSIGSNLGSLESVAQRLTGSFANFGSSVGNALGKVGGLVGPALIGVGALAAGFAVAGFAALGLAKSMVPFIQNIENMSEKTGISRDSLVAWEAVAKATGVSTSTFQVAMRRLEIGMSGVGSQGRIAKETLKELGISTKDPQEALLQLADVFQKLPDGARKAAIAMAVFGRSGTDMIPVLDQGRAGIQKWTDLVHKIGPDISDNTVKAVREFKDATTELGLAWDNVKIKMTPVLNLATTIAKTFAQTIEGLSHKPGWENQSTSSNMGYYQAQARKAIEASDAAALASAEQSYDLAKAQGPVEAEIARMKQDAAEYAKQDTAEGYKKAAALEAQIAKLEPIAKLEKKAREEAERRAQAHADVLKRITEEGAGTISGHYLGGIATNAPGQFYGVPAIAGFPQAPATGAAAQAAKTLSEAPEFPGGDSTAIKNFTADLVGIQAPVLNAKDVIQSFSDTFENSFEKDRNTLEMFTEEFKQLYSVGAISAGQFSQAMAKISQSVENADQLQQAAQNKEREALDKQREALGSLTEAWGAFADSLNITKEAAQGDFFGTLTRGVDGFENSLAKFIVTGRGGFQQVMESMAESLIKLGIQFVISATKAYILAAALAVLDVFTGGAASSSGFGTFLKGLDAGGDAAPGQAYIVGEHRPELFVPSTAGRVIPNLNALGGGNGNEVHVHMNISTMDSDSFSDTLEKHSAVVAKHVSRQLRQSHQRMS